MRYLSVDWIDAISGAVAASESLQRLAPEHEIGFTQIVTDGPEGDVTYHLQVGGTRGKVDRAVAVATGALNAQEAFVRGQILLRGDQQRLLDSQPLFGALDAVFSTVRADTRYE